MLSLFLILGFSVHLALFIAHVHNGECMRLCINCLGACKAWLLGLSMFHRWFGCACECAAKSRETLSMMHITCLNPQELFPMENQREVVCCIYVHLNLYSSAPTAVLE